MLCFLQPQSHFGFNLRRGSYSFREILILSFLSLSLLLRTMNELNKDAKGLKDAKDTKEPKDKEIKDRESGVGPGRRKTVRKGMFAKDRKLVG